MNSGRTIIYLPIIHTEADMGALNASVRRATLNQIGLAGWRHKQRLTDHLWTEIEKAVDKLKLSYEKVRLYQDGLPVCGCEVEIVKDLVKAGSRNYQLVFRLMEKGAQIMGTESPELLVEEYEMAKQTLAAGNQKKGEHYSGKTHSKDFMDSLLKKRDRYISERINKTLDSGETGILFLGILHSLENQLDEDIRIIYPIHKPLVAVR